MTSITETGGTLPIAIIGLGCRYPDARNPKELWEDVLARRQSFRRMPDVRLPLSEYGDPDKSAADKTYASRACVIDGFDFDWARRRIPKQVFEQTDIAHWLALEVALQAVTDAGYEPKELPRDRTGVIVGNTLTGEQQRAHLLRGRWPFVRKTIRSAGMKKGVDAATLEALVAETEQIYKSFFPAPNEDSLAGALSNTIAGRICNYMDLRGGGYTVDGACASSLLSVATASNALAAGDIDVALAGGVDVSLDPFELVGFSKVGALSDSEMKVYDRAGNGFLPGEGCGFIVMKRLEDAKRDGDYVYAVINGWGVSSDGKGGITAPTEDGQALALRRAYDRAGYSAHDLDFVEGHGTGTAVGDPVELTAISNTIDSFGPIEQHRCGVTSFKSLVGHTKAAAGIGGLLKAIAGVNRRVIPPTAGCDNPHEVFAGTARNVYPVRTGLVRDASSTLTAGVSAMGFGGINSHVTITSGDPPSEDIAPELSERALLASHQATELFVLVAENLTALEERATQLLDVAVGMSVGEMPDLALELARKVDRGRASRAAIVASSPQELHERLEKLIAAIAGDVAADSPIVTPDRCVMLASGADSPRIGFLFPGQGSQQLNMARTLVERFDWARDLVANADAWLEEVGAEPVSQLIFRNTDQDLGGVRQKAWMHALTQTEIAQPAICLASLLWLRFMERLGIEPYAVGGHSLGELTAFHAAGAFSEKETLQLAALRGRAMASVVQKGTMASLACDLETAERLLDKVDGYVVVANINSSSQVAISGQPDAVAQVIDRARDAGIGAISLRVSGAFHSKHFEPAAEALLHSKLLARKAGPLRATLLSAVDGRVVSSDEDLGHYFANQMLARVDFVSLTRAIARQSDLLVEVGPGTVLSRLVQSTLGKSAAPCLALESKPGRDRDLNIAVGALFAHGARVQVETLYENRLVREFVPASERIFIQNPCEKPLDEPVAQVYSMKRAGRTILPPSCSEAIGLARNIHQPVPVTATAAAPVVSPLPQARGDLPESMVVLKSDPRTVFIDALARRTGFPRDTLTDELRLLDDLHLDSIKAVELISEAASVVGAGELDPGEYLNGTLLEIIAVLEARQGTAPASSKSALPAVPTTVSSRPPVLTRNFVMKWAERPLHGVGESTEDVRVLIVAQPDRSSSAVAVQAELQARGAVAELSSIDELTLDVAADFNHFVVLVPRALKQTADHTALLTWTRWLSTIAMALPTMPPDTGSRPLVAFIRWEEAPGQEGYLAAAFDGFVASLHLERRQLRFRSVVLEDSHVDLVRILEGEFGHDSRFEQVRYDSDGKRWVIEPEIHRGLKVPRARGLSAGDLVLVTGGARGITAECALALAESTDVRMVLIGSSPPPEAAPDRQSSHHISSTLARFREKELWCEYRQCDMRDRAQVQELVESLQQDHGPLAGVIHGSAVNTPRRAHTVGAEEAFAEIAPKLLGGIHLFEALEHSPPKIFIALTSIIGVAGMPNNAWYAFSNQSLDHSLGRFHEQHPQTEVVSIAYSVWDKIGMGADLGRLEHLEKIGVDAIPVEDGVNRFVDLATMDPGVREVVVSARLGGIDTWRPSAPSLPIANRFLDQTKSFSPGVELTVRTRLTTDRDPYLLDHDYKGSLLFPTVFGLEAMGQVAACVTGRHSFDGPVVIEDIELSRPLIVNPERGLEIEVRAKVVASGEEVDRVEVAVGCEQTGFRVDHFSARFVLGADLADERVEVAHPKEPLPIDPKRHLYGDILFQGPRFQRIDAVYELDEKHCLFTAEQRPSEEWILGDPYFRDALLQSVQLCVVPDQCLPVKIGRMCIQQGSHVPASQRCFAFIKGAAEQAYETRVLCVGPDGRTLQTLDNYQCKVVDTVDTWPVASDLARLPFDDDEALSDVPQNESTMSWPGGQFYRGVPGAGPEGQTVFIYRFPLAGQDSVNLGRTISFSSYARWAGRTRELAVINTPRLHRELYELLGSNAFAGATNSFETSIFSYPGGNDLIETHFWIAERTPADYVAEWRWWRLPYSRETERELVATSRMRVSAVEIIDHGVIKTGAWPEFLDTSLVKMGPQGPPRADHEAAKLQLRRGSLLHQETDGPMLGRLLISRVFETSLRDSNLVGNLYFGNFASWQGHVRDVFLHRLIPEYYRGKGERGELLCTNFALDYLREAMPFDRIEVRMYLGAVYESGVDLAFEYYRIEPDDTRTKLAIARHSAVWATRDGAGTYVPARWPQAVMDALMGSDSRVRSAPG
jgi:enediyne polyketide synthase